MEKT
ncbi:hypothetical protein TIFTF001_037336 [Ficus carica]|jgi:hypothetical protein